MGYLLTGLLLLNLSIGYAVFISMYRQKSAMQDRFAMTMATVESSVLSLSISMIVFFILPGSIVFTSLITTIIGIGIGYAFGSLLKFQSLLAGVFQGMIGGIMGPMLAAVIEDPAICSLPATYTNQLSVNIAAFSLFSTLVVLITSFLVYYSLRI
ncbi:hypothetical protein ACLIBH_07855 [Virgibacillus sp. W0430]|uniref:hypothetical protein n=1 Tax=Virgibacillus sp. W0430 TaxID=3391580 RepID=UPI003F4727A8